MCGDVEGVVDPLQTHDRGYTMLELLIVMTVVGILATLAEPLWQQSVLRAREAVLKQTLFTMRDVLDQYRADRGKFPETLADVVKAGYMRQMPVDPFTKSAATWQEIPEAQEGGIGDVHSGSPLIGIEGSPYNQW